MGDLLRKFLEIHASEDKVRWKDLCWSAGTVVDPISSSVVTSGIRARPLSVRCGSGTNQAKVGRHVTPETEEGGE